MLHMDNRLNMQHNSREEEGKWAAVNSSLGFRTQIIPLAMSLCGVLLMSLPAVMQGVKDSKTTF